MISWAAEPITNKPFLYETQNPAAAAADWAHHTPTLTPVWVRMITWFFSALVSVWDVEEGQKKEANKKSWLGLYVGGVHAGTQ